VLTSLSGIFRGSFANVVDLLDDMIERCAKADEPIDMNFIRKHSLDLENDGVERSAARLFSNPPRLGNPPLRTIVISDIPTILKTMTSRHVSLVKCLVPCQMLLLLVLVMIIVASSSSPHCQRSRGSHFGGHEHEKIEKTL
jgi:hypothetical protein